MTSRITSANEAALGLVQQTIGAGLATVACKTSEAVGFPVWVLDAACRPVADSNGAATLGDSFPGLASVVGFLRASLSSESKSPVDLLGPMGETGVIVFPAKDWKGDVLGYVIGLFPPERSADTATETARAVFEAAAVAAAAAFSEQQAMERIRLELEGDFFERLLSPGEHIADDLLARANALGIELSEFYWPCLVDCGDSPPPSKEWVAGVRRDVIGGLGAVHVGMDKGALYLLVPTSGIGVQKRLALSGVLSQLLTVVDGHSRRPPFALLARHSVGLVHVGRDWNELMLTRRAVQLLDRVSGVHDVNEFVLAQFLLEGFQKDRAVVFVEKMIGSVLDYDRLNHTRLLIILEAYLDCGCSSSVTARATNYHRNTVGRQLERLQLILGHSLDDPSLRLGLHLAVKIHHLI